MDCSRCRPGTTTADDSRIDVAGGQHIDGTLDIVPVTCTMCHGTEGVNPAPPVGTRGETETSAIAVGAHQKHVQNGLIRNALDCAECHVEPNDPAHANGTVDLAWGDLAVRTARRRMDPRERDVQLDVVCTARRSPSAAGSRRRRSGRPCRRGDGLQLLSRLRAAVAVHPQNTNCNRCHEGTVLASGAIDVAGGQHIDGTVQVSGMAAPLSRHRGVNPAPPVGTKGETLTTQRAVGAHQKHVVDGLIRKAFACGDCHAPVTSLTHVDGTTLAPVRGPRLQGTRPSWTGTSCSSTYCHGATLGAGGSTPTPTWTAVSAGPTGCGSCHGSLRRCRTRRAPTAAVAIPARCSRAARSTSYAASTSTAPSRSTAAAAPPATAPRA